MGSFNDGSMFKPRHDEIHSFLEWRRRTRFIRHHGGPIMALGLFCVCLWYVWKAFESRLPVNRTQVELRESTPRWGERRDVNRTLQPKGGMRQEADRTLQASKFSRR